eukprot:Gb_24028 [translate_table: standard]
MLPQGSVPLTSLPTLGVPTLGPHCRLSPYVVRPLRPARLLFLNLCLFVRNSSCSIVLAIKKREIVRITLLGHRKLPNIRGGLLISNDEGKEEEEAQYRRRLLRNRVKIVIRRLSKQIRWQTSFDPIFGCGTEDVFSIGGPIGQLGGFYTVAPSYWILYPLSSKYRLLLEGGWEFDVFLGEDKVDMQPSPPSPPLVEEGMGDMPQDVVIRG